MAYETLTLEHDGPIARVWLDRPHKRNALDARALEEITDAFTTLGRAFDTRVVILGGRGASFCAGADRTNPPGRSTQATNAGPRERRHAALMGRRAVEAIERVEAITIARVHGHAIGGGVLLALACDLRVAEAGTVFHVPEVDLGVPLTWGGVPRLARAVGPARAKELILLCDRFDAAEAERLGLLNRVTAPGEIDGVVDDWANRLAAKPAWALHMTKTQFRAYAATQSLGDVTEGDGDLLTLAALEDSTRFGWQKKGQ
jgi:enoyl-CoA hydratase/carnithine racemase